MKPKYNNAAKLRKAKSKVKPVQIVIEVQGGVVQEVYFSKKGVAEYYILDHDNIKQGDTCDIPPAVLKAVGCSYDPEG